MAGLGGSPAAAEAPLVSVNGTLVPRDEIRFPRGELAWLRGYGVFETLYRYPGGCFQVEAHLQRLEDSAALLRIPLPPREVFRDALQAWTEATPGYPPCRVRITVVQDEAGPWWMIDGDPVPPRPPVDARGVRMWLSRITVPPPPLGSAKTISRVAYELAAIEARAEGADDAILPTVHGDLGESTRASVFYTRDGLLFTPPLSLGILPGVTRQLLLDGFRARGRAVEEVRTPLAELWEADEVFACSTVRGVAPVTELRAPGGRRAELPVGPAAREADALMDDLVRAAGLLDPPRP